MGTNTDRFIVTTHLSPLSRHALLMWVLSCTPRNTLNGTLAHIPTDLEIEKEGARHQANTLRSIEPAFHVPVSQMN